MATDAMIEVDGVSVRLGGTTILTEIDAAVGTGRLVGLIGPNGAGKTTLLRTINGIVTPAAGAVRVDGIRVDEANPRAVSRRVATVPQDTTLAFDFTVEDVIGMGRTPYRSRIAGRDPAGPERVRRAMERTQTLEFADRPIGQLSGGERQRVILARALAQDTPVLLLDEPTASLDINHQVRTFELIRSLVAAGEKTIMAAIHDLNLAAHYCDKLFLLGDGRLLAAGEPAEVLTEDRLSRAFGTEAVVSTHPVTGSVYVTAVAEPARESSGAHVHVIGGGGTASRLLYVLSAAGFTVSIGALNEGDTDLETARNLGIRRITVPPFSAIDTAAERAVVEAVTEADVVVVADVEIGPGNLPNMAAAAAADSLVMIESRPLEGRNFAGTAGERRYRSLRQRARVIDSVDGVVRAVEATLESSTPVE